MQVIIISNDQLKEELLACPVSDGIKLHWINEPDSLEKHLPADAVVDLLFQYETERIKWLSQLQIPLIIINSVINTLEEIDENFIRINGWNTFLKRQRVEASCKKEILKQPFELLFKSFGKTVEWVPDIAGMITPRIVSCIINEAHIAMDEKVSNESEIDIAMKLGTNYPYGPFEWCEKIGPEKIFDLLNRLSHNQERYIPSRLLKSKTLAG